MIFPYNSCLAGSDLALRLTKNTFSGEPKKSYDVALLKLRGEAEFTDFVSPICLPDLGDFGDSSTFPAGMECILSGKFHLNTILGSQIYLQKLSLDNFFKQSQMYMML
jgi:hypothetical protein